MSQASLKASLKAGTKVWLMMPIHGKETRLTGTVVDLLSEQFTVLMDDEDGAVRFRFYKDTDWGIVDE